MGFESPSIDPIEKENKLEEIKQKVRERFARLAEDLTNITGGNVEISFESVTHALPADNEPTKVILHGSVDLTSQHLGGDIDNLPKILDIKGPVVINAEMIDQLHSDSSFRDWNIDGPVKILGTEGLTDEQKKEISDKLATSNGVGTTGKVEFA